MKESILNTCPFLSKMTFIIKETAYSNKKPILNFYDQAIICS